MCVTTVRSSKGRRVVVQKDTLPPEVERAARNFFGKLVSQLDEVRSDLVDALENGRLDLQREGTLQTQLRTIFGSYSSDLEVVFREAGENGAQAGRAVAARQYGLDIDFSLVPERTLRQLDDWAERASNGVLERMADDIAPILRGAHEEGLRMEEIRDVINQDVFDNRLQDWEADRIAQTETINTSNEGTHSAFVDASSVVGEEWLDAGDSNVRASHQDAHGQIVAVENTFLVGGHEAQHPADLSLPAEERISCRCTIVPVFRDELSDQEYHDLTSGQRLNT